MPKDNKFVKLFIISLLITYVFNFNIINASENTRNPSNQVKAVEPQTKVPVDMKIEETEQKSADEGHSPWRLDPIYVAQVFISLKIYPGGIQGDYPIKYDEFKIIKINNIEAIIEVGRNISPISKVYLKRLIKQGNGGIWTVIGYNLK